MTNRALPIVASSAAVLLMFVALLTPGCGDRADADKDASKPSNRAQCPGFAVREDGTCCAPGAIYVFETDSCHPVGPAGCAGTAWYDPLGCIPVWCRDGDDTTARECTPSEAKSKGGCPAGTVPSAGSVCHNAGAFAGSGVDTSGSLENEKLEAPPATGTLWPDLVPLADPVKTTLCLAQDGSKELTCVLAGVPWKTVCPPGFVVDAAAATTPTALPACTADPADCGDDPYGDATLKDGPATLFVDAKEGSSTGKGTRASPLATLLGAIWKAPPGTTIALAAGDYDIGLGINRALTIRGRCAAMTRLRSPKGKAGLRIAGPFTGKVVVERAHIVGPGWGIAADKHNDIVLRRLWISGVMGIAVGTIGEAGAELRESYVEDMQFASGATGVGANVPTGGQVSVVDVRIRRATSSGMLANGGAIKAERVLVDGTRNVSAQGYGYGISAANGGSIQAHGVRLFGNHGVGFYASDKNTVVFARGVAIERSQLTTGFELPTGGVRVRGGATFTLQAARITHNAVSGISVTGSGTKVALESVVVDNTQPTPLGKQGRGINVSHGASLAMKNTRVSRNHGVGVAIGGKQTRVDMDRVLIDATRLRTADNLWGWGVNVDQWAELDARDIRITGGHHVGLSARNMAKATVVRGVVDSIGKGPKAGMTHGGIIASTGATLQLRTVRVSGAINAGIVATDGADLRGSGVLVDGTISKEGVEESGRGIIVQSKARAHLVGSASIGNRNSGFIAVGAAEASLVGMLVAKTGVDATGKYGTGMTCDTVQNLCLILASRAVANHTAALTTTGSNVAVRHCVFGDTGPGKYPTDDQNPDGPVASIADGLMASTSSLDVRNVLIDANARSGVLLRTCPESNIRATRIHGGQYGLVFSGHAPKIEHSVAQGSETDVKAGLSLYIPPPPSTVEVGDSP